MRQELTVIETETALFVASATDPTDWVACFQKNLEFPARAWAEQMAYLHNRRLAAPQATEAGSSAGRLRELRVQR